jgi:hypothetical protein
VYIRESYAKAYSITPAPRIDAFSNMIEIDSITPGTRVKPRGILRTTLSGSSPPLRTDTG